MSPEGVSTRLLPIMHSPSLCTPNQRHHRLHPLSASDQARQVPSTCTKQHWPACLPCSLAEGRQPWTRDSPHFPAAALAEADAGLWALTAGSPDCSGPAASCVLAGSEEGCVLTWDARSSHAAWKVGVATRVILEPEEFDPGSP